MKPQLLFKLLNGTGDGGSAMEYNRITVSQKAGWENIARLMDAQTARAEAAEEKLKETIALQYRIGVWVGTNLVKPNFGKLAQHERLLRVAMLAFMKLHPMCSLEEMTESEVSQALMFEICNTIGDPAFCKWLDSWKK